ncbi:MAG: phosphoribosylglycinamide formyltransferase [Candidatus Binatia bacterium]
MAPLSIGILASGSGTNFESIAEAVSCARIAARIPLLLCNRPAAGVLAKAEARGIPTRLLDHRGFASRADFDGAIADILEAAGVELVVMAGFDRIVTGALLRRFPQRVVNIHPALLPSFRGTDAQGQAADYGVTIAGATVHFVDEDVDHGPILLQGAVPVVPGENAAAVRQRILAVEHRIYPEALRLIADGRVRVEGRFVHVEGRRDVGAECLISPPIDD